MTTVGHCPDPPPGAGTLLAAGAPAPRADQARAACFCPGPRETTAAGLTPTSGTAPCSPGQTKALASPASLVKDGRDLTRGSGRVSVCVCV